MTTKPCKECGSEWHTRFKCPYRERKTLQIRKTLKATKPMNKIGRVGKETGAYVAAWKRQQTPDADGMYTCYISGVKIPYLMAEHPYSKARHPELRTNQILEPVSAGVNRQKGSLDIDDFLEKYPQYKKTVKPQYLRRSHDKADR